MSDPVQTAKRVLAANTVVQHGIFGAINSSGFFPPMKFLNQFLVMGNDPCDQDGRMGDWPPFILADQEYLEVKEWWIATHAGVTEDNLGADCWDDWIEKILND
jgi:hypothetical protein